ncbi:hypothetical protein D3C72_1790830 [compost metagenome]
MQFVAVVEVGGGVLLAEEQPVAAVVATGAALVEEATERRHTGARANHDHRHVAIDRRAKMLGRLDEHRHVAALGAVGEKGRRHAFAFAIAHGRHREVDFPRVRLGA